MGAGPGVILLAATLQGNHPNNPPVGYYNILPSRVTLSESNFPESVSRKIMTLQDHPPGLSLFQVTLSRYRGQGLNPGGLITVGGRVSRAVNFDGPRILGYSPRIPYP